MVRKKIVSSGLRASRKLLKNLQDERSALQSSLSSYSRMLKRSVDMPSTHPRVKVYAKGVETKQVKLKDLDSRIRKLSRDIEKQTSSRRANRYGFRRRGMIRRAIARAKRPKTISKRLDVLKNKYDSVNKVYVDATKRASSLQAKSKRAKNKALRMQYEIDAYKILRSPSYRRIKNLRSQYQVERRQLKQELAKLKKTTVWQRLRGINNFGVKKLIKRAVGKLSRPIRGAIRNIKRPKIIQKQLDKLKPEFEKVSKIYDDQKNVLAELRRRSRTAADVESRTYYAKAYKAGLGDPVLKQYKDIIPVYKKTIAGLEKEKQRIQSLSPLKKLRGK